MKRRRVQQLTESNRETRLQRPKRLLKQYRAEKADFIWFTDEKIFTVARPKNTQTDRIYAPVTTKRDRYTQHACSVHAQHSHSLWWFQSESQSWLLLISSLWIRASRWTENTTEECCCRRNKDEISNNRPAIREMSGDFFVFQQDSAPAHRAWDTLQLLQWDTPEFIAPDLWPPNSPDLNPVDYTIWRTMQQRVTKQELVTSPNWRSVSSRGGMDCSSLSWWMKPLMNGASVCKRVFMSNEDISST